MLSLPTLLTARFQDVTGVDPELRTATRPQFGHFQSNVALRLAKVEGKPPREIAQRIVAEVDVSDVCEPLEIAGPGFINIRIKASALAEVASQVLADEHAGISRTDTPQRVVIDYSAPNVAKQMHVGHLRTTIIGDCFNRVLTAKGHTVIAQNHLGDWGRQFGMLVEQILDEDLDPTSLDLSGAEALYLRANARLKVDALFADRARARVVLLQSGDELTLAIWRQLLDLSLVGFNADYGRLNVLLTDADVAGESTYNDDLPVVAADLEQRGIAVVDNGALVVFVDGFTAPLIVRNSHGGFGYACTDLAAVRHRVNDLAADRLIYVVGQPQAQHFALVFAVCGRAGYLPPSVSAEFVGFGQVLGPDGKRFSTRDGSAVPLSHLLDLAEAEVAPEIALGAIKYADLSSGLQNDYTFDPERMVATTGNTGPYLQYAHARTSKILRDAEAFGYAWGPDITVLNEPAEHTLALSLSRFGEVVDDVARTLQPHRLCGYLFDLATDYSSFYEQCPVLKSEGDVRSSRLALCAATKKVLARGLYLLGIEAPERM